MIEVKTASPDNQIEIRMSGRVTQTEYEATLIPALEKALGHTDHLRVLAIVDEGFTGFDLGAAWADTKMGLAHWRGFDRAALATDSAAMSLATRAFAPIMPCPVRVVPLAQVAEARAWLREAFGSIHVRDLGGPAIEVTLHGKPDPEDYARTSDRLDAHIKAHGDLRLLLDMRAFEGWQGLSALAAHFRIARSHIGQASRVAMVGDKGWQHMAERVGRHIVHADMRYFDGAAHDDAVAWIKGP